MSLASNTLEAARSAFYHLAESQAESAAAQARLITTLPVFRAYMTDTRLAHDAATLDAMTDEYRRRLRAQFCILTDRTGRWTATPGWRAGSTVPPAMRSSIGSAVSGRAHHDIVAVDAVLFLVVSEPASFAEETLGTLTFGYALTTRSPASWLTSRTPRSTPSPATTCPEAVCRRPNACRWRRRWGTIGRRVTRGVSRRPSG